MRRIVLTVCVATMLVLSGCAGLTGDSNSPETQTHESNDTDKVNNTDDATNTTDPRPTNDDYAPGGGPSSLGDIYELNQTTVETLHNKSYTLTFTPDSNETEPQESSITTTKSDTGKSMIIERSEDRVSSWYFEGESIGQYEQESSEETYAFMNRDSLGIDLITRYDEHVVSELILLRVAAFDFTHVNATQQNGKWVHEYQATGVNKSLVNTKEDITVTDGNLTVTVREDGVVIGISGAITETRNGNGVQSIQEYELTDIGKTTTDPPEWYTEDIPELTGELTNTDRVLKLTHTNGPTIGPGAHAEVNIGFETEDIPQPFSPGETLYVYATEDDTDSLTVEVSQTPPTVDEDLVNISDREITIESLSTDRRTSIQLVFEYHN